MIGLLGLGGLVSSPPPVAPKRQKRRHRPGRYTLPEPDARDVEAIARGLASEVGGQKYTPAERRAVGWSLRLEAEARGRSPHALVFPWRSQGEGTPPAPWSTRQAATERDRRLARLILRERPEWNPIPGATTSFEPALQDLLAHRGAEYRAGRAPQWERFRRYYSNAAELRRRWSAGGLRYVRTVGRWEFWGPK